MEKERNGRTLYTFLNMLFLNRNTIKMTVQTTHIAADNAKIMLKQPSTVKFIKLLDKIPLFIV